MVKNKVMKIHTHNVDKVVEIIKNISKPNDKGQLEFIFNDNSISCLRYKIPKKYFKLMDLTNEHYWDLPEFKWSDYLTQRKMVEVELRDDEERDLLLKAFGQKPIKKNYFYYDLLPHPMKGFELEYTEKVQAKYPIYVITKGRWEKTYSIDTLEDMGVDFYICVEPKEYDQYCSNPKIDKNKILVLPENFSEKGQGAVPVRNWVWEHSVQNGHPKHWQLDDNISWFYRWNENVQVKVRDGVFFRVMEDFSDRYENLGLTSPQYHSFVPGIESGKKQFIVNTRCYSCILINTELLDKRLEERWRGRYNDDTDLTLRVLSTGDICTVNFHTLLQGKMTSGSMKGGMQEMYKNHSHLGYQKKFDSLKEQWGDIVTLTNKKHVDGRPHHHIEYTKHFTQPLKLKEGVEKKEGVNNYNMVYIKK
jgi:hypothetical protein